MSLSNKELLDKSIEQLKAELLEYFFDCRLKGEGDRFMKTVDAYATEKAKELFTRSEVESCIKDSLQSAADNVRVPVTLKEIKDWAASNRIEGYDLHWSVDKSSITDPKNIKIK